MSELTQKEIIENAKYFWKCRSDSKLAVILDVHPMTVYSWRQERTTANPHALALMTLDLETAQKALSISNEALKKLLTDQTETDS